MCIIIGFYLLNTKRVLVDLENRISFIEHKRGYEAIRMVVAVVRINHKVNRLRCYLNNQIAYYTCQKMKYLQNQIAYYNHTNMHIK